jgi:hypothetical protein
MNNLMRCALQVHTAVVRCWKYVFVQLNSHYDALFVMGLMV